MIISFGLFIASFLVLVVDLLSKKKNNSRALDEKLPKLGKYSFMLSLISILLLVFVSFAYVPL
jgi:hypothetical protein